MTLHAGRLYWPHTAEHRPYPTLENDATCDVLVIGAGISGALAALCLIEAGLRVIVVEKGHVGGGSTSATTALVEYELDRTLVDLRRALGPEHANAAYDVAARAVLGLQQLIETHRIDADVFPRPSVFLCGVDENDEALRRECEARAELGLDVSWLTRGELASSYGLSRAGAIRSELGLEINPLKLTYGLLRRVEELGGRVHEGTEVHIEFERSGVLVARSSTGPAITTSHAVIATGYETPEQFHAIRRLTRLRSTYAIASEPIETPPWPEHALVWEHASPYFYARTTPGGRIIAGGADEETTDDSARDALISDKARVISDTLARVRPGLRVTPAFAWTGTFAETEDSLPYIGELPRWPRVHFSLGYGGNGITYSYAGARIITAAVLGRPSPWARWYAFDRR